MIALILSEGNLNALIIGGFAFLTACLALLQAWTAYWIRKLEKNTNSMKDALVQLTGESEHAKGILQEKTEQAARESGEPIA